MRHFTCKILRKSVCNLDDCMEKADSKDNLPPLASQNVAFKETAGDLCEGSSHVGSQAFRRLVSHLAMTSQRPTEKTTSNPEIFWFSVSSLLFRLSSSAHTIPTTLRGNQCTV